MKKKSKLGRGISVTFVANDSDDEQAKGEKNK